MTRISTPNVLACLCLAAGALHAQGEADSTLVVSARFAAGQFVDAQAPIELALSRLPAASEGRIAVFVGSADLTSLFAPAGTSLVYRANGVNLPSGESEIKVFRVAGETWTELARIPLKVLTPRGFERSTFDPALEVRNTGQLAAGNSGSQLPSDRPRYQAVAGTLGLQTVHARNGMTLTSDVHAMAAGERVQALRFAERGVHASRLDLADYAVRLEAPHAAITVGQVSAGGNRHLINGFASRGISAVLGGGRASLSLGAENGTSVVGIDNFIGLEHADHRVLSSTLALEMLPARPGALHVDFTGVHGSLQGASGFTSGGIVSADRSDGYGIQVAASTASQRVRFAGGYAGSRSQYAADPPLSSGGSTVPSPAHQKSASYLELDVALLQARHVGPVAVTLAAGLRHERVDPLYRTVASPVQSDVERDGVDLTGTIDAITLQVGHARTADNIDRIASLLTSRGDATSVTVATPLAALFRVTRSPAWLPALSWSMQRARNYGDGIPTGGAYTAGDIPDLLTTVHDASAQWQVHAWQLGYHLNRSVQDNSQPGYELSDYATRTHGVTLGRSFGTRLTLGTELGIERQENRQAAMVNDVKRGSLTGSWRAAAMTTVDGSVTMSRTQDPAATSDSRVSGMQFGLSQGLTLWRSTADAPRGQLFARFSRQALDLSTLHSSVPPTQWGGSWNVASGLSLRFF